MFASRTATAFVTMLRKPIADHWPELIGAVFDVAGPTFRDDLRNLPIRGIAPSGSRSD